MTPSRHLPITLEAVEGLPNKRDTVYANSAASTPSRVVVFFHGDVQNFQATMEEHNENKQYTLWSLEKTSDLLIHRFPDSLVLIIVTDAYEMTDLAKFSHFVRSDWAAVPIYEPCADCWQHLRGLVTNSLSQLSSVVDLNETTNLPLTLVGFSKGGVVLNQLLCGLVIAINDSDMAAFIKRITDLYWLDGGHAGISDFYILDREVLAPLKSLSWTIHVHTTPYHNYHGSEGEEKQMFISLLKEMSVAVNVKEHFDGAPATLETHFSILTQF